MNTATISILDKNEVVVLLTFTWEDSPEKGKLSYSGRLAKEAKEQAPRAIVYTPSEGSAYRPQTWAWVAAFAVFLISGRTRLGMRLRVQNAPKIPRSKPIPVGAVA